MGEGERDARRLVIGITGPVGSGVSTTAKALANQGGFHLVSLAHHIKEELRQKENLQPITPLNEKTVPDFRRKLQDIGNSRRESSPSYWVDKALLGLPSNKDIVIDGIRNLAEVEALRSKFSRFFLIAVHAPPEVRWSRVQEQYDKNYKAFERDDKRDSEEDSKFGQQVEKCVLASDYVRVNDSDDGPTTTQMSSIYNRIRLDIELMRGTDKAFVRPPTADEAHMAAAYAEAHISQCLKRHVGALIVAADGRALSMGYNENPFSLKPCKFEFNGCFKDMDMEKKLEAKRDFHCPKCGERISSITSPWKCSHCMANLKGELFPSRNMELCTAIHAEERAIRSLEGRDATGGTIYSTTFPCFQCARYIIDAGIKRVVYVEAYPVKASLKFLNKADVTVEAFQGFQARAFNTIFKQVD
jgi:deoxycytidylate deaminase